MTHEWCNIGDVCHNLLQKHKRQIETDTSRDTYFENILHQKACTVN